MPIEFLTLQEVIEIHRDQIERYGGSLGVRDFGLLQSAVAMPIAQFGGEFLHVDLFEMAAAYLFHLVQNHPFIDGNKRAGAATADVFLTLNDHEMTATEDAYAEFVLSVAQGQAKKSTIAEFFRANVKTA
ncbi:MAG: type II toxin-antitoxin system death-on-curing family toxin [Planctomycetaceae bacterium]|nr:type II toxin-antitoxin system death-on-curing family toxin [Planctomycetaceae bacterium]